MAEQAQERPRIYTTMRDYLSILFRRRRLFFAPLSIVFSISLLGAFFWPKTYRTGAIIMIEEPESINPLVPATPQVRPAPPLALEEQRRNLEARILTWPNLLEVIRRLKLEEGIVSPGEFEELIAEIGERFAIEMVANNIFQLFFEDRDPVKAQAGANNLTQIFIEVQQRTQRESVATAADFIGSQLESYDRKLKDADEAVYEFREESLMSLPGVSDNINIRNLALYEADLFSVDMQLKEAGSQLELIKKQISGEEGVVVSETLREINPVIDQLYNELTALEVELTALLSEATEEHPRVIELRTRIARTQERLQRTMEQTLSGTIDETSSVHQRLQQKLKEMEFTVVRLRERKAEIENIVEEYRRRVEEVPGAEQTLQQLSRDQRINETIYGMLKERLEASLISQVEVKERGSRYRILAPARLPLKPAKPNKPLLSLAGFVIGAILGFGCVFLAEFSDHSFHGLEDARVFLELPVLAAVPAVFTPEEINRAQSQRRFFTLVTIAFTAVFIIGLIIGLIRAGY